MKLRGIVSYPITPFTEGRVDEVLLGRLVEDMVGAGVHAIAPLGSTGVLPYLSDEEREQVAEVVVKRVAGRVPTLVGVSSLTTEQTVRHAKYAEKVGASAVMIIPMSYWKLGDAEILGHFDAVAKAISIPIAVYNNPATGGLDLSPDILSRLLRIPNVTMVKESTGDVNRMHRLVQLCGE
ncbi:MAG: dihydrodipicolinate synthase family protein, partial [Myxococcaceae bacterium]